jgi:O-antigen ligase/tetratricopeptide (TPR) repeat protein
VRRWRPASVLLVAVGVVLFGYLAWDGALWDARLQLLLHLVALAGIAGLAWLAGRGMPLPATPVDLPVLLLLVAFGAAALTGENVGLGGPALLAVLATALMLPIAILALKLRPRLTALVTIIPIVLLGGGTLAVMLPRRVAWYLADGPGLVPPARLGGDGSPFGSVAVPPFVFLAALVLTLLIDEGRLRRWLQGALIAVGIPLTAFSGSRAAWLAIAVAGLFLLTPLIGRVRVPRRPTLPQIGVGLVVLAAVVGLLLTMLPRLTAFTSIIYRGFLWRDTLAAWSVNPILGVGPGTMPFARQAAAPPLSFPVRQPHSHNLALGVLGDTGLVGLAFAIGLVVVFFWVAGPWRQPRLPGRAAASVLAGFLVAGMFDDMTFLPGFNLLVLLLAAMTLLGADRVRWRIVPRRAGAALALGIAAAAGTVIFGLADASAILYRGGVDAFVAGDRRPAATMLAAAERLDPWHPAPPKALAVASSWLGDPEAARAAAQRALARNPGDGPTWTNLSLACEQLGDASCALEAARRAIDRAQPGSLELLNAAVVLDTHGRAQEADAAYRLSLLTNRSTGLAHTWPRSVPVAAASVAELGADALEMNRLIAQRTQGLPIDPGAFDDPATRALAAAMVNDRAASDAALAEAQATRAGTVATWDISALLATARGEDATRVLRLAELVRGAPIASEGNRIVEQTLDIGDFRAYPADGFASWADRLLLEPPWPWILEPLLAEGAAAR